MIRLDVRRHTFSAWGLSRQEAVEGRRGSSGPGRNRRRDVPASGRGHDAPGTGAVEPTRSPVETGLDRAAMRKRVSRVGAERASEPFPSGSNRDRVARRARCGPVLAGGRSATCPATGPAPERAFVPRSGPPRSGPSIAAVFRLAGGRVEVVRLGAHPIEKFGERGVTLQAVHVVQPPREFAFRKPGMDGAVAHLMELHRAEFGTSLQLGNEVVPTRSGMGRDGPVAERADRRRRRRRRPPALAVTPHGTMPERLKCKTCR